MASDKHAAVEAAATVGYTFNPLEKFLGAGVTHSTTNRLSFRDLAAKLEQRGKESAQALIDDIILTVMEAADPPIENFDPLNPTSSLLGRLAIVLTETQILEEEARNLVSQARDGGATWSQIGAVAGIKPQSAYQRWSEKGREKHREYQQKRRDSAT